MDEQKKYIPLEEALKLYWLEESENADIETSDKALTSILNMHYSNHIDESKEKLLLDKLYSKINVLTFGQLISETEKAKSITDESLAEESKLSLNIISNLKSDLEFPNNIPIVLLKNLLKKLDVTFKEVEQSIWKTFEILKNNNSFASKHFFQPVYKRKEHENKKDFIKSNHKSFGKELYENEDALKKYLSKLENLMR